MRQVGEGRFEVEVLTFTSVDSEQTCSTLVRNALLKGDVATAARHLGRPFRVRGGGRRRPTRARTRLPDRERAARRRDGYLADGVYAGWLRRPTSRTPLLPAAISVGTNPTFDGIERRVESYVLDRADLDLTGSSSASSSSSTCVARSSSPVDDLIAQMTTDVVTLRALGIA